ncbi:hypothetical protein [Lacisediminihabitans sp.]|uniref:hypothetical protein n=1 Tax=Lacisediminihabitans sp. TaxID=2787631 RepID=UPI0039C8F013
MRSGRNRKDGRARRGSIGCAGRHRYSPSRGHRRQSLAVRRSATVAIERGPLVIALESNDLAGGRVVSDARLDASAPITATEHGARVSIIGATVPKSAWPYALEETSGAADHDGVELIPYFTWANRGPSTMRVWLPVQQQ